MLNEKQKILFEQLADIQYEIVNVMKGFFYERDT